MRRPGLLGVLALPASLAVLAPLVSSQAVQGQQASERTSLSTTARLTPLKAGTEAAPRSARLRLGAHLRTPLGAEKPVLLGAKVLLPRGIAYNGGDYPLCTWSTLELEGPAGCPRRSVMGRGTGTVESDGESSRLRVKVVNGGASRVYGYVTLAGPARVSATVPIAIKQLRRGRWRYRLTVTMPRALQSSSGMPIALQDLELDMGKGAKGTRHRGGWLATTRCPKSGRLPFVVTALLDAGPNARRRGSMRCR